jgi:hypothetical protein
MPAARSAFLSCRARIFSSMEPATTSLNEHGLGLAEAVGAVGGLVFDGGVPPRVVVDHRVGGGEVEADAAGLEADEEDRHGPSWNCRTGASRSAVSPVRVT